MNPNKSEKQINEILEAKKFLERKQEEHKQVHGVYFDTNSKIAEVMHEFSEFLREKKRKEVPENILSKDKVLNGYKHYLTVGDIKKHLDKYQYSDEAKVIIERVEDRYYEVHGWGVYLQNGQFYNQAVEFNEEMAKEILLRENGVEPQYPGIENPLEYINEPGDELKEQFTPAWCIGGSQSKEEQDLMFIYMHY